MHIKENRSCYATPIQREVLLDLITNKVIEESFFLTGGTALSVFYLHHRLSNDLDFFALNPVNMAEIDLSVRRRWPQESAKIKEGPNFLSFLIKDTKVDFVVDPLSSKERREDLWFENGQHLYVDTIDNISSNKFCTVVSRIEPKDFIDFYFIQKVFPEFNIEQVYDHARRKEVLFEDPPTAAFQLEEGLAFLMENRAILPITLKEYDINDLFKFYQETINWLYQKVKM
ncbi:MAG: hypothetical protein A2X59_12295 [Nitrospirae bacterium GWC2_42_7]|nr:MAG: hypothetical protein A2X59_12295 [Nitrospirae bacterium GWC2_42_7]